MRRKGRGSKGELLANMHVLAINLLLLPPDRGKGGGREGER